MKVFLLAAGLWAPLVFSAGSKTELTECSVERVEYQNYHESSDRAVYDRVLLTLTGCTGELNGQNGAWRELSFQFAHNDHLGIVVSLAQLAQSQKSTVRIQCGKTIQFLDSVGVLDYAPFTFGPDPAAPRKGLRSP